MSVNYIAYTNKGAFRGQAQDLVQARKLAEERLGDRYSPEPVTVFKVVEEVSVPANEFDQPALRKF